jgi:hypothetical protein
MVATYISQAPGNELLVYASFATGKGGRAARDLVLANATARFLSGEDDLGFSSLSSTNQQNLFYLLSRTKTGTRISDAYRRIFRSIDHSLSKVTRSMDHSLKDINRGVSGTSRGVAKAMDGGARWLASGGKYSRNKGNDIDAFYGDRGIDTNGLFKSIQYSDVGRGITKINQEPCVSFAAGVAFGISPAGKMFGILAAAKFGAKAYEYYTYANGAASASSCLYSMDWGLSVPASSL